MGRERAESRARLGGFAASILLHLLIVVLAGGVGIDALPFTRPPVQTIPAPDDLIVVEIAEADPAEIEPDPRPEPQPPTPEDVQEAEEEPPPEEEPDEEESPEEEAIGFPVAPGGVEVGRPLAPEGEEAGRSNAARLRLRFSDARIWFDPRSPRLVGERLVAFARADSAVRAILRVWLDSLELEDEARTRALDWTTGSDGERWGISPEGLHLGNITIPIPFGFAPNGPERRAYEQAIRDLTAIQLQDLRRDVEEAAAEARRRMQERADDEIRRRSGDTLRVRGPPPRDLSDGSNSFTLG